MQELTKLCAHNYFFVVRVQMQTLLQYLFFAIIIIKDAICKHWIYILQDFLELC